MTITCERTAWGALVLVQAAGIFGALQIGIVAPLMPDIGLDLGLSRGQAGLALSLITAAGVVLALPSARLMRSIGFENGLALGLTLLAAAAAGCALAPDGPIFMVLRTLAGVGYVIVVLAAPVLMVRRSARRDRGTALAIWSTFVPVGLSLGALTGGGLLSLTGWRIVFAADAAAIAMLAVACRVLLADPRADRTEASPVGLRPFNVANLRVGLAMGLFAMANLAIVSFLAPYLRERHDWLPEAAGAAASLPTFASILGSFALGLMLRRGVAAHAMLAPLACALCVLAAAVYVAAPVAVTLATAILFGLLSGSMAGAVFAAVPELEHRPAALAQANAVLVICGNLGSFAGPPVFGFSVDGIGWTAASVVMGGLIAVAAVVSWPLRTSKTPPLVGGGV